MRTRRSWRNQEALWRALSGPKPPERDAVVSPVCGNCNAFLGQRIHAFCAAGHGRVRFSGTCEDFQPEGAVRKPLDWTKEGDE